MHFDAQLGQIIGQVLGHSFGQRRHQRPFPPSNPLADLADQVVDLSLCWFHDHFRIDKSRGPDDLIHDLGR